MTTTAVECARLLVQELAPDQGQSAGRAFGLAVSLQAMLEALHDPSCEDDGLCQKLGCLIANFHMRDLLASSDPVVLAGAASALAGRILTALAAAPAPSSLAGGEVTNDQIQSVMLAAIKEVRATVTDATEGACMDADIIRMERGLVDMGDTGWAVMRSVHRRLAALSPEAPAREGVGKALHLKLIDTLKPFAEVAEKLKHCPVVEICEPTPDNPSRNIIPMPREWFERAADDLEAIAIQLHSDGVLSEGQAANLTGLDRVEVRKQVDALTPRHEAPAEGAGEAMTEREVRQWIDACNHEPARQVLRDYLALRARSSAPEARGEALGNLLAVIHGDGGHRALEVGTKQAALEAEKIVAGLFAAPSADKLRGALEDAGRRLLHSAWAVGRAGSWSGSTRDAKAAEVAAWSREVDAALKAEG